MYRVFISPVIDDCPSTVACQRPLLPADVHCCLPTSTVACQRPLLLASACCCMLMSTAACRCLLLPAGRIVVTEVAHRAWSCQGTTSQSLERLQDTHQVQPVTYL